MDTVYIHETVVTAPRPVEEAALSRTEVDTLVLQEMKNHSLAELLSIHTPVFVKSYGQGSMATASFRGTAASHTQVRWNGMEISDPMLGQTDLSLVPAYFIDDMTIYHGGSSLMAGSGALGGTISMGNRPRWDVPLGMGYSQLIGSYGTCQGQAGIQGGNNKWHGGLRYVHEQSRNDFEYYNNANGLENYEKQQNGDYQKDGLLANLHYRTDGGQVFSLHTWAQQADRDMPPLMTYQGSGHDEYQKDRQLRLAGSWEAHGQHSSSKLMSGYAHMRLDYYQASHTPGGTVLNYDSRSYTNSQYNNYVYSYRLGEKTSLRGLANFNYHQAHIYDHKELTGYDAERQEAGLGASMHHRFTERLAGYALLRHEYSDWKATPLMPSLGCEYAFLAKKNLLLKTNLSRNYHLPSLNDLYWLPGGNPALKPEQGYTGELTLQHTYRADSSWLVSNSLNTYLSRISDWIVWRPGEYRFWQADNIKEVLARGIEYQLRLQWRGHGWQVDATGQYAYTRTENMEGSGYGDASVNKQLIYIPLHSGGYMQRLAYQSYWLSYSYSFTGERYTSSSNAETRHSLPAYGLHYLGIGKELVVWQLKLKAELRINNLLDTDYQAILWRAMPGRHYQLVLSLSY